MPGMFGFEVLRIMKEINCDIPVIISSAFPEYKEDLDSWAYDAYVVKSANTEELFNSIENLIGKP